MTLKDVFVNSKDQMRNGWRMALYLILFTVISIPIFFFAQLFLKVFPLHSIAMESVMLFISAFSALLAGFILLKFLDKRDIRSLGMGWRAGAMKDWSLGLLIGFMMLCFTVGLPFIFGWMEIRLMNEDFQYITAGLFGNFILYLMVGFNEEILFRGYLFQSLTEGIGKVWATLLFSVVFGLAHAGNPNVSVFGLINIVLAGILLSIAYLRTRSLWLPVGIHTAWNFTQGIIWGLPVSGTTPKLPMTLSAETGPDWITGGSFGPEGGAACTLFCLIACFVVWKYFSPTAEMSDIYQKALQAKPFSSVSEEQESIPDQTN